MPNNKGFSVFSSRGTKKKGSLDGKAIDGTNNDEKTIDDAATAYIHRVRSRLDNENKGSSEFTSRGTKKKGSQDVKVIDIPIMDGTNNDEQTIDYAAMGFIHHVRSRHDYENRVESGSFGTKKKDSPEKKVIDVPISDGKADGKKSVDDAAEDYINRVRYRFNVENENI